MKNRPTGARLTGAPPWGSPDPSGLRGSPDPSGGALLEVRDPATEAVIERLPPATAADAVPQTCSTLNLPIQHKPLAQVVAPTATANRPNRHAMEQQPELLAPLGHVPAGPRGAKLGFRARQIH